MGFTSENAYKKSNYIIDPCYRSTYGNYLVVLVQTYEKKVFKITLKLKIKDQKLSSFMSKFLYGTGSHTRKQKQKQG